jgi:hypothetical protein
MTLRRLFIALALALTIAVPVARWRTGAAGAQTGSPQITVDPTSFKPGDLNSLTVSGTGFAPNEDISVGYAATEGNNPVQESASPDPVSDSNGAFTTSVPVPTDIDPGDYSVYAIGPDNPDFATNTFTVNGASGATDTPTNTPIASASGTTTVTPSPTNTSTPTPTTVAGGTATPTPTTIPGGTATATITATVTPKAQSSATSSPTPTSTATVAPTDTPTLTAVPGISFTVEAVKVAYGSANPTKAFTHGSLSRVKAGQKVKLILYAKLTGIDSVEPVSTGFRVTSAGKTVLLTHSTHAVTPAENGHDLDWTQLYIPRKAGHYTFDGTLFVGSHHRHKSINFAVG